MCCWKFLSLAILVVTVVNHDIVSEFARGCSDGWQLVDCMFCAKLTDPADWYEAKNGCESEGGWLFDGGENKTSNSLVTSVLKAQETNTSGWIWVNAGELEVQDGKVWAFDDGTLLMYFYWDRGEPSYSKRKEDHILMSFYGRGRWNDEEDTTGYIFFNKANGVICQDNTAQGYNGNLFTVWETNYTIVYGTVFASDAELLCNSRTGGTLARLVDQTIQDTIWQAVYDGPRLMRSIDFWIAGKRLEVSGVNASGVYWLNSKTLVTTPVPGEGIAVAVRMTEDVENTMIMQRFQPNELLQAICIKETEMVAASAKTATLSSNIPENTTLKSLTGSTTTVSPAVSTTTYPISAPAPKTTRLVITAQYLLAVDCKDAMMEPQPAVLLSAARYKYKDMILICDYCFSEPMDVRFSCKQRTLTMNWLTTRFYDLNKSDDILLQSRDRYIYKKRAEFMHHVNGPHILSVNILKNQPPVVFPERQADGSYIILNYTESG